MFEELSSEMLIFLIGAGFIASFIDSVVGGGGLISVPSLMMTGVVASRCIGDE